jgi:hypothetical protein
MYPTCESLLYYTRISATRSQSNSIMDGQYSGNGARQHSHNGGDYEMPD